MDTLDTLEPGNGGSYIWHGLVGGGNLLVRVAEILDRDSALSVASRGSRWDSDFWLQQCGHSRHAKTGGLECNRTPPSIAANSDRYYISAHNSYRW